MAFKVHFLNVGCADCTMFEMDNDLVIVDCGYRRIGYSVEKPTSIGDYMRRVIGKHYIDLLIITHPHHDHYLGIEELMGVTVAEFWGSPYERRYDDKSLTAEEYQEYCTLKERLVPDSSKRKVCSAGASKSFASGCTFTVLGPDANLNKNDSRECHDGSLVVAVSSPNNRVTVCGDASDSALDYVRSRYNVSSCRLLRASHHGSINGANLEFIKAAKPIHTVISTKSGVYENVPHPTALQRYREHTSGTVKRTDLDGTLTAQL